MDYRNLILITTIGLSIISQSLHEASVISTCSSRKAVQALAFISGSGLEFTIQHYGLDLNATRIRSEFYAIFKIRREA